MLTAAAFLLAFAATSVMAILRHPIYGLVAYLGVFYLHPPSRWWGYAVPSVRWSLLAAVVTFAAIVIHRNAFKGKAFFSNGVTVALGLFIVWLGIQSFWALDETMHAELLNYYVKYLIAVGLIYKCVDSEQNLKILLWAHVLGSFLFGWDAFVSYEGGRFEDFGGPGFSDANFAAIHVATGILACGGLFLAGSKWERLGILIVAPFIVNGFITTMSRSGFLALACGGIAFTYMAPPRYRLSVTALGSLALVLLVALAHEQFWERIGTIQHAGEQVEGVDTGSARLVVWQAQMEMFSEQPLGCGHRCTAVLSPNYLEARYLTSSGIRSSHNTYLTLLVEQGIPGSIIFLLAMFWIARTSLRLRRQLAFRDDGLKCLLPSAVAILVAISVADIFVDYLKLEVRMWYIAVLMVLVNLARTLPLRNAVAANMRTGTVTAKGA